jgi:peptide/nickel transport system substrate-binding protein
VVARNDNYWLSDADGNQYPYLDEIEFVVQEEDLTRERALVSGEIDMTHTDKGESVISLREEVDSGNLAMYEIRDSPATTYALINKAAPDSPVADVRIRQAMAYATDQELRNQSRTGGVFEIANGPFSPGSPGYLEDNGFPEFDQDKARELVDEYKADVGVDEVKIRFDTTADPDNRATVELLQQMYSEVGIEVEIAQYEQGEFITNALNGDFEVFTWRGHGGTSPDTERVWWHSETALPVGEIALNFGRIEDDVIDENLQTIRETEDQAVVTEAAEAINRRFAEQVYNIWSDWVFWSIPHKNRVHGVQTPLLLPDGTPSAIRSIGAVGGVSLTQVWVDDAG